MQQSKMKVGVEVVVSVAPQVNVASC